MSRGKAPRAQVNEGIQANTVTADVLAVGRGATATKNISGSSPDVMKAIGELRTAIEALNLQPHAKAAIDEDLRTIDAAAQASPPEPERGGHALQNLAGKLKMVGIVLAEVVALSEPARKIAEMLQVPLRALGL